MDIIKQAESINPSAKDPLFRRIMAEDDLAYLREEDYIIGFEVDLTKSKALSGYTIIGIQKHTILAYRSDLDEELKLILFPSMEKLFDEAFELLGLSVVKKRYRDSSFVGEMLDSGIFRQVVADLTPPMKDVDLPSSVSDAMVKAMLDANASVVRQTTSVEEPVEEFEPEHEEFEPEYEPEFEPEPDFDEEPPFAGEVVKEKTKDEIIAERVAELRAKGFRRMQEVADYVVLNHGIPREIASQVMTGVLRATQNPDTQVEMTIELFERLYQRYL